MAVHRFRPIGVELLLEWEFKNDMAVTFKNGGVGAKVISLRVVV